MLKKTKYIIIKAPGKLPNLQNYNIKIAGVELIRIGYDCEEPVTKFLGLFIDDSLSWKCHMAHVNSKISRAMFAINQVKHFLPYDSMKTLYFSLVHPHILYGILAWGNAKAATLHKTIVLQKRALRTMNNAKYNSHTEPLFKTAEILKVKDLYEYQILLFMYDYCHNKLPKSFNSTYKYNHEIQILQRTRQSDLIYISRCRSNFAQNLPLIKFPQIWNKWAPTNFQLLLRPAFKRSVKSKLLSTDRSTVRRTNTHCSDCRS